MASNGAPAPTKTHRLPPRERVRSLHQPKKRILDGVDDARGEQDGPDAGERHAQRVGVELGHVHVDGSAAMASGIPRAP